MRRGLVWLLGAWIAVAAATTHAMPNLDVPLDHWSYEFIERLALRAQLGATFLDLKPLTRGEMAAVVRRIAAAARTGAWTPSPTEAGEVEMLRSEFSEELAALGDSLALQTQAYHLWQGDGWRLQAFYRGRERFDAGASEPAQSSRVDARVTLEPAAALELAGGLLAAVQVNYRVRTSTAGLVNSADPRAGEAVYVFQPGDRFSIERSVDPTLRYARPHWRLDLSRTRLRWGPGRANAMLLSGLTPPLDALRVQIAIGPVRFTSLAGQLRPSQLVPTDPVLNERYLAAHRLEIAAGSRLHVAVSEALVYGNRGLDLSYVNPLAVLFVTQANNGDVDNALVSVDGSVRATRGLELYGECVVDDLNLRRGLRHYGNKLGLLAGIFWQRPFGAANWDVDAEWSWASLFTYTHHTPIDRYEHYGNTLGSRTGPDSDLWVAGVRRRFAPGWAARAFYELERHGEGSLAVGDDQRTSDTQSYLNGIVESRHQPGIELRYTALRSVELLTSYRFVATEHPDHSATASRSDTSLFSLETRLEF